MRWHSLMLGLGLAQGASHTYNHIVDPHDIEHIQQSLQTRGGLEGISNDLIVKELCIGCQGALLLLKGLVTLNEGVFIGVLKEMCKLTGIEDDDVCDGAIDREGPILAHAIKVMNAGSDISQSFCVTFFGLCEYPEVEPWSIPEPSPKPSIGRPLPSGQTSIRVVHYSDIHIDPFYVEGSSTDCTKPICCRPYSAEEEPGRATSPAGPHGDHRCDVPVSLEESMYAAIRETVPDAAFTIFTGDVVDHAVWNTSKSHNQEQIINAYMNMDVKHSLVYATAGNHEAHPTNAYHPNILNHGVKAIYSLLSSQWSRWLVKNDLEATKTRGVYSTKYRNGNLRVISLNTNLYCRQNYWLYQREMLQDPSGQLEWLADELDKAEAAGENVYIIGHIPLGDNNAFNHASNHLDQLINRYSATIAAMFFGHTHVDSFQLSYSNYSERTHVNALTTSYIAPSLTPTSGMPSFRVYEVDPVTFAVMDATTYIADMKNVAFQTTGPVWTKYYSAKEAYGPVIDPPLNDRGAELTAAFWHNVTVAMEADPKLFDKYQVRKSRGWREAPECDEECRAREICHLRAARSQDNCQVTTPGQHFNKRAENRYENRDECGISVSRATLGALAVRKDMLELVQRRFLRESAKVRG